MITKNKYPVCEHDTSRNPIINPADFLTKTLPEKCVITFFGKELNKFVEDKQLPVIGHLHSEVLDIPIYEHAMGCEKFIICGGAGSIKKDSKVGELIVPVSAVRDEGTSYHYLEPSREVECHKETVDTVISYLKQMGIPFTTGKTWTTDAIYRETPEMIELRRNEGCITVEMEAAAFFAVSKYYDIPLAQLLYAGDDVSGEVWDSRNWDNQKSVRSNMILTSIELVREL